MLMRNSLARWASCLLLVGFLATAPGCGGGGTSNGGGIAQPAAPVIATQPATQTIVSGGSCTFSVAATTTSGTLSYQWRKGTTPIPSATSANYPIPVVQSADAGSYDVVVSSSLNGATVSTTSHTAVLSVNMPPTIIDHPQTQAIVAGNPVTFSVNASGNGTLSYQWRKNDVNISGATLSSLVIPVVTAGDAGNYNVQIINTLNATTSPTMTSSTAVLTVKARASVPNISASPVSSSITEGGNISLSVNATGNGLVTYQWYKDTVALPGKTGQSLDLNAVTLADSGSYTVMVTNTLNGTSESLLSNPGILTVTAVAPSSLAYTTSSAIYTKGTPIAANTPSHSGGAVVSYSITPALPAGLLLNTSTGIISGTPSALATSATYTVTATNTGGATDATLTIVVNDVPPSSLAYTTATATYTLGSAISPNNPSANGGPVVSYSITPVLPTGLLFNTTTGIISGTPSILAATASYTVTATNSGGNTTATLTITVNDAAPTGLTYSTNPAIYTKGVAIASNTPSTSGGGAVISYAISPALPTGLNFSTSTGIISGTPSVLSTTTTYTVTATNTGGSTPATVTITVNDVAPTGLTYSTNPAVYTKGSTIASNTPSTSGGGAVVSYVIFPALPTGLNFNTSTGVISGTPSALSTTTAYTVTATNTGGNTPATVTITVNDVAPSALTYSANPAVYSTGALITPNTPTSAGGAVVSYSVSPSLPTGLSLNTSMGVISGTPTTVTATASYTITATNTGGSTQASLSITVNPSGGGLIISVQPQSQTVIVPSGNTFSVTASGGTPPYSYQWKKNNTNIGTDSSSYTVSATDLNEITAQFSVVVTDSASATATSENATMTVMAPEPTYAGDPIAVPNRALTVVPSYHVGPAFPHGAFRLGYDETVKNPVWTAYANFRFITKMNIDSNNRTFLADDRMAMPRVMDNDFNYAVTTMTRGHQVPMSNIGTRYGQQTADDTCYMSNVAPQVDTHNNNIWNSFEQMVDGPTTSLAMTFGRTWIYTGPTFDVSPTHITGVDSGANIAIPNGFYKIIVRETAPGVPRALAILTPHQPTPATSNLWQYVTSIARIEALTKLDLFPNLPGTPSAITQFKNTVDVTGWGTPFEKTTGPNVHMVEPSWDISVSAGTTVNFVGAASSATSTVSNPSWTFGSEGTSSGYTTTHTFNTAGSVSVTFAITDGASVTNTITRVVTVTSGNAAPTISSIGAQSAVLANPVNVSYTVNDDATPKNLLVVTATSSNQAVLADGAIQITPPDATTGIGNLQLTGTGNIGTATITVRVTDSNSASAITTFSFTVSDGNAAPVITGLSAQSTAVDTPILVNFTVSDTETPAGSLTVSATSSDTTLIPGTLTVTNTSGACNLTLTPGAGLNGSATITISVLDGGGKTTTGTFSLTVGTPATPTIIISQYYEGTTASRFIEITNVGTTPVNLAAPQVYLVLYANPTAATDFTTKVPTGFDTLTGTLAAGQSKLYMQSGSTTPAYAVSASTIGSALSFNGNDPVILSLAKDTGTAWSKRFDMVGLIDGSTAWGTNLSLVRNANIVVGNTTYAPTEWTIVSIPTVDAATTGTTERLGEHVYTH